MSATDQLAACKADEQALKSRRNTRLAPDFSAFNAPAMSPAVNRWFADIEAASSSTNDVVAYAYGRCAFRDMADALFSAYQPEHSIYIVGWQTQPDAKLAIENPPLSLQNILQTLKKPRIRGLFNGGLRVNNTAIAKLINSLGNGAAILDTKLPKPLGLSLGSHHQKLLVVDGKNGLVAFVGGMDFDSNRLEVRPTDPKGSTPWHDVQVRITGAAAAQLLKVFRDRWLDHPDSAQLDMTKFGRSVGDVRADFGRIASSSATKTMPSCTRLDNARPAPTCSVAVGRTFANLTKFEGKDYYGFVGFNKSEQTAWKIVSSTINKARTFLYIEDQYLVSRRIQNLLKNKLQEPNFKKLIMLFNGSPAYEWSENIQEDEFPYLIAARNEMRQALASVDGPMNKWGMYALKPAPDPDRGAWCGNYVHSKTIIADDECVVVGTVNMDDRGYTFDTEIATCITNDVIGRALGGQLAKDLRISLWHKHLGVPHAQLDDFIKSSVFWKAPSSQSMAVPTHELEYSPLLKSKAILKDFKDADQMWSRFIDPDADKL